MKLSGLNNPWGDSLPFGRSLFLEYSQSPEEIKIIQDLAEHNNLKLVLIGANAVNAYSGKPRMSQDVDFVCDKPKKLIKLIRHALPQIEIKEESVVYRLLKNGLQIIDIIKPYNDLLLSALSKTSKHKGFIIPTIEVVVALKYAAMISPHRQQDDQSQDAVDFARIVRNNPKLNVEKTAKYASSIHETAAGEIKKFITDIRAGRRLRL